MRARIEDRLGLFSVLLCFGTLAHMHRGGFHTSFHSVATPVLLLGCAALLLAPSSRVGLGLWATGAALDVAFEAPYIVNHWVIIGILALTTGVALALSVGVESEAGRVILDRRVMGAVGAALCATYFWAGFHKLNSGFFDPVWSCAVEHQRSLTEPFGLSVPSSAPLTYLLVAITLAIEFGVPVLLMARRTRWLGVAVGFVFHFVNALNGHHAFSALALALFVPFIPKDTWRTFAGVAPGPRSQRFGGWAFALVVAASAYWLIVAPLLSLVGIEVWGWRAGSVPYLVIGPVVAAAVAAHWWETERGGEPGGVAGSSGRDVGLVALAVTVMVSAVAMSPYLGAGNTPVLAMFSNLRAEPGHWNHLIVPESFHVVDDYDDYLDVDGVPLGTETGDLEGVEVEAVNLFEVQRQLSQSCEAGDDLDVTIVSALVEQGIVDSPAVGDVCAASISQAPGLLERKVVRIRPLVDPNGCQH